MANITLVLDCSISASVRTSSAASANDMKSRSTITIATTAPRPGALAASRVSSLRFSVTSQPQKKNSAVRAPVANSCGVNEVIDSQCQDSSCAGCDPYSITAATTTMTSTPTSMAVITIC